MTKSKKSDPAYRTPQFQLGPTTSEAKMYAEITANKLEGPGGIVDRLQGKQWSLARAETDESVGDRGYGGNNLGEIG
jgi:hypothetical protein